MARCGLPVAQATRTTLKMTPAVPPQGRPAWAWAGGSLRWPSAQWVPRQAEAGAHWPRVAPGDVTRWGNRGWGVTSPAQVPAMLVAVLAFDSLREATEAKDLDSLCLARSLDGLRPQQEPRGRSRPRPSPPATVQLHWPRLRPDASPAVPPSPPTSHPHSPRQPLQASGPPGGQEPPSQPPAPPAGQAATRASEPR